MGEQPERESAFPPAEAESGVQVRPTVVQLPAAYPEGFERPRTYGECAPEWKDGSSGGCPLVACKHNTFLEVHVTTRRLKLAFPTDCPTELPHSTCALWLAEHHGGLALEEVARLMGGLTKERIRQIEVRALAKFGTSLQADRGRFGRRIPPPEPPPARPATRKDKRSYGKMPGRILARVRECPGIFRTELAAEFVDRGGAYSTVHSAISDLVRRGMLENRGRRLWCMGDSDEADS